MSEVPPGDQEDGEGDKKSNWGGKDMETEEEAAGEPTVGGIWRGETVGGGGG